MSVGELIDQLKKYDRNLPVICWASDATGPMDDPAHAVVINGVIDWDNGQPVTEVTLGVTVNI